VRTSAAPPAAPAGPDSAMWAGGSGWVIPESDREGRDVSERRWTGLSTGLLGPDKGTSSLSAREGVEVAADGDLERDLTVPRTEEAQTNAAEGEGDRKGLRKAWLRDDSSSSKTGSVPTQEGAPTEMSPEMSAHRD